MNKKSQELKTLLRSIKSIRNVIFLTRGHPCLFDVLIKLACMKI